VLTRTASLLIAFAIAVAPIIPAHAEAPSPSRPIRIVVPFGPGGPPDGYRLFVFSSGIVLSKSLLKSMPFDPVTAFSPITTMALFDLLLLVRADSPLHTLTDALDAARANPRQFDVATISPGSTQNVTAELLRNDHRAAPDLVGSADRALARRCPGWRRGLAALKSAIDTGQVRAIASSGSRRSQQQPNVPTLRENGIDAAVDDWNSLVAPAGTPREIISFLNHHVRAIISDPDYQKRMIELGGEPVTGSPEELDARLKSDADMWAGVVKKAGLEPN
jgi:tripartite-type tricarboxylate transporter receptor subunit TctC